MRACVDARRFRIVVSCLSRRIESHARACADSGAVLRPRADPAVYGAAHGGEGRVHAGALVDHDRGPNRVLVQEGRGQSLSRCLANLAVLLFSVLE